MVSGFDEKLSQKRYFIDGKAHSFILCVIRTYKELKKMTENDCIAIVY